MLGFVVPAPRPVDAPRAVSSADIIAATADALHQLRTSLVGASRYKSVAYARHIGMYVARKMTGASFPEIARAFGDRDHTTVMSACRKIQALLDAGDAQAIASVRAVEVEVTCGR